MMGDLVDRWRVMKARFVRAILDEAPDLLTEQDAERIAEAVLRELVKR